ncbi:MAG: hypothetical protein HGA35_01400 [Erysipelotrichaceae bacterium]|nr:hypothetical protein [Erysipelotrichaceae bacterium]
MTDVKRNIWNNRINGDSDFSCTLGRIENRPNSMFNNNYLYLSYSAKTVIIVQISMHIYLLVQMFRINGVTNPITALNMINKVAIVYQILGVFTLVLSFCTFVFFTLKLGANSLHE